MSEPIIMDLSLLGEPTRCKKCKAEIVGTVYTNDNQESLCFLHYCEYVATKFGQGNPNPDDYRIM